MNHDTDMKKKLVEFGVTLALMIVLVKVQRAAAKPDFGRTFAMRSVWGFKRFADGQVKFWEEVRGAAATKYNALKP